MKKQALTLFELLAVIVLVAVLSGLFGFRFWSRGQSFFFEKEKQKLQEKLVFIRHLALFRQAEVQVDLKAEKGTLFLQVSGKTGRVFQDKLAFFSRLRFLEETEAKFQTRARLLCTPQGHFYPPAVLEIAREGAFKETSLFNLH
ncbi:MAG: hypothetical protein WC371_02290 [Parachlamydiales bacterium]